MTSEQMLNRDMITCETVFVIRNLSMRKKMPSSRLAVMDKAASCVVDTVKARGFPT